jgi:hypothetical protein
LNSVGEILDQLHLRFKELLHCRNCLIDWRGWSLVLLISNMSTDHKRYVLTSSGPSVYHLIVHEEEEGISEKKWVEEPLITP